MSCNGGEGCIGDGDSLVDRGIVVSGTDEPGEAWVEQQAAPGGFIGKPFASDAAGIVGEEHAWVRRRPREAQVEAMVTGRSQHSGPQSLRCL